MDKSKLKIVSTSENIEKKGYEFLTFFMQRIATGIYYFKTRKGELSSAAVTFYLLLSFCPLFVLVLYVYSNLIGDVNLAYTQIMSQFKESMPELAPWIYKSIQSIVQSKISGAQKSTWFQYIILLYSLIGFSSALINGLHRISDTKSRGGKFVEEFFAIMNSFVLGVFLISFLYLNFGIDAHLNYLGVKLNSLTYEFLIKNKAFLTIYSFCFFVFYFKTFSPIKIRHKDALLGAFSFIGLFFVGKSFYWVYLHYARPNFVANFGNFSTIVESVCWVYFLVNAFYLSSAICFSEANKRLEFVKNQPINDESEENQAA